MTYLVVTFSFTGYKKHFDRRFDSDLPAYEAAQSASDNNMTSIVFEDDEGELSPVAVYVNGYNTCELAKQ